jgi:hypothetical protein
VHRREHGAVPAGRCPGGRHPPLHLAGATGRLDEAAADGRGAEQPGEPVGQGLDSAVGAAPCRGMEKLDTSRPSEPQLILLRQRWHPYTRFGRLAPGGSRIGHISMPSSTAPMPERPPQC